MTSVTKILICCFFAISGFSCYAQPQITTAALLHEMIDYSSVAKWPDPFYYEYQASSYDRKSVSPDKPGWFANGDASQYIRSEITNGHTEQVMLDADGPGAVVRFWLTTFKRDGIIRIYFDGNNKPEITIPAYDLMRLGLNIDPPLLAPHSSYEPKEKGGSTLYLPLPFAKHCKITFEDKDTDNQPRYYQINYRKYEPGTRVKTFSVHELDSLQKLVKAVNHNLQQPDSAVAGKKLKAEGTVRPRSELTLNLPEGPVAIGQLVIKVRGTDTGTYEEALHSALLKLSFDGRQTVVCPLDGFSGSGYGGKPLKSWYRTVKADGTIITRWVMPYRKSAKVVVFNSGKQNLKINVSTTLTKWRWDANSLYFHADYRSEKNVPIKRTEEDGPIEWDFNRMSGKGIYLGDTFAVYNHMHKWYGEGDQKLWVDGKAFPAEYGTGTEDYYNTSWAPVVLYQTPFANAPRADNGDSFGYNTFTRTRNLDRVPFKKSFRFSLEMLGWENGTADCAAVTYWYGSPYANRLTGKKIRPDIEKKKN
ncbi:MAG TPA: glycoside hydrolase family 172 protein [Mucilaginibacter sp.]|nr:glycoside hydrolase family 172 protein [Mucilaginibacter sp.]